MRFLILTSFLLGLLSAGPSYLHLHKDISADPQNSLAYTIKNANWVATDALGRSLPSWPEVGPSHINKYVGIFYFLWHGAYPGKLYDISKLIRSNTSKPAYGPAGAFHWWGEPEADYYKADDPWLIRRNLQMLTNAGIDVLFMDVTNGDTYLGTVIKLCSISLEMRQQGQTTPYICFVTNSRIKETIANLYTNFYTKDKYASLWFRWDGKPLVLGRQEEVIDPVQRAFFTWRYSWQFTDAKTQPGHWQWLDNTPQNYGWVSDPNKPEEIPVAVASHPVFGVGKSSVNGRGLKINQFLTTPFTNQGLHFAEQWQRALTVNPSVIFVTGWNEWIAQRFVADTNDRYQVFKHFINHKLQHGETFFQDLYNEEFNRDIEPMKGGYSDNYYYQLIANVRRFKGMSKPEVASNAMTLVIDGKFDEWNAVKPVFKDPQGDTFNRNWPRCDNTVRLINTTGRNDLVESRIAQDKSFVYAFARTVRPLTAATERNWMLLFIDSDQSKKTGWQGYDVVINRQVKPTGQTSVHRWIKGHWQPSGTGIYKVAGQQVELRVPKSALGFGSKTAFDFHWADNIQKWNDISEFMLNGDSAPDRRFNYRYIGR